MKKQMLNHCKSRNTRQAKRTDTLEPKGMESGYNGYEYVIANGRTIPGLQMASTAFTFICDAELGNGSPEAIHRCHRPQGGALSPICSWNAQVETP